MLVLIDIILYLLGNIGVWVFVNVDVNNVFSFGVLNINIFLIIKSNFLNMLYLMCNYVCVLNYVDCLNLFYVFFVNMLGLRYIVSVFLCFDGFLICESKCFIV